MAELFLVEAVNEALHLELERDDSVMVMGEDVGRAGGVFRATAGLRERFGENRCVDTPLAEAGILGSAVGLCMAGWRPVCEMQYDAFSYPCLDELITHVGRYRWRTGGKMEFPLVVRMPYGGGVRAPELHDDSPEAYYVHTPGVKVAIPSTPADAKGLLAAAIRDPDPVVVLEPKLIYRAEKQEVPEGEHVVLLGQAARSGGNGRHARRLRRDGARVRARRRRARGRGLGSRCSTSARSGRSTRTRCSRRLPRPAVWSSCRRRRAPPASAPRSPRSSPRRRSSTFHGPVIRVTGFDVPYPYWKIEDRYMPSSSASRLRRGSSSSSDGAVHLRDLAGEAGTRGRVRRGLGGAGRVDDGERSGRRWAKLLRDTQDENRFITFGPWESLDAIAAWRELDGFRERVGRVRELLESFEPFTLEPVVEVG